MEKSSKQNNLNSKGPKRKLLKEGVGDKSKSRCLEKPRCPSKRGL